MKYLNVNLLFDEKCPEKGCKTGRYKTKLERINDDSMHLKCPVCGNE